MQVYFFMINLIAFFMMGLDKRAARRRARRIPESYLLFSALLGGAGGALLGMHLFHHKTKKRKFSWGVPLILFAWLWLYFLFKKS